MRQVSTQPEQQALAFASARVSSEKMRFLEVPFMFQFDAIIPPIMLGKYDGGQNRQKR
jgi:hypothetical protein